MTAIVLALLIAGADEPVKAKMPLGKDTTVVDGPLTKDGYIDYGKALQERMGKGVTAETNAVVLLWKASGPKPEGAGGMHPDFFAALGMPLLPEKGDYFLKIGDFCRDALKLGPAGLDQFLQDMDLLVAKPWSANEYPHHDLYLNANAKPLALVVEASKRKDYFNPLVSNQKDGEPNILIGALLPNVQKCREYVAALNLRVMRRLDAKDWDGAWEDILAIHRLGRLMSRGGTLIEYLVAVAVESIGRRATLIYLEHAPLTADQMRVRWKEIQSLPAIDPLWPKIDVAERYMYLDSMQIVRRGQLDSLVAMIGDKPVKLSEEQLKALDTIDWAPILRGGNKVYDEMVAAMKRPTREARAKAFDVIDRAMKKKKAEFRENTLANIFAVLDVSGKTQTTRAAELVIGLMMPAVEKVSQSEDRRNQEQANLDVAFALAIHKAETGSYPAKLDELVPKKLSKLPDDAFSGKTLLYRTDGKSFTLWSVGLNGKDDGARNRQDDPPGDDLVITLPRVK